jgi:hypothetical protein
MVLELLESVVTVIGVEKLHNSDGLVGCEKYFANHAVEFEQFSQVLFLYSVIKVFDQEDSAASFA